MNERIRNVEHLTRGTVDFGSLSQHLPGKAGLTNVDGLIERRGHFLALEVKEATLELPLGQRILLEALLKGLRNSSLVLVVACRPHQDTITDPDKHYQAMEAWVYDKGSIRKLKPKPGLLPSQVIGSWYRMVSA